MVTDGGSRCSVFSPFCASEPSSDPNGGSLVGASGLLLYLLVFRETLITVESVERIIGLPVVASVGMRRSLR